MNQQRMGIISHTKRRKPNQLNASDSSWLAFHILPPWSRAGLHQSSTRFLLAAFQLAMKINNLHPPGWTQYAKSLGYTPACSTEKLGTGWEVDELLVQAYIACFRKVLQIKFPIN